VNDREEVNEIYDWLSNGDSELEFDALVAEWTELKNS
jgi:hypothetical protein